MAETALLLILLAASVMRSLVSLYPWLDISLDISLNIGTFHMQLVHFASLTIWISLSLIYQELLQIKILMFRLGVATYPLQRAICTALAAPYPFLVVIFIYKKWVSSFAVPFQLIYLLPSTGFILHTVCQAYIVSGCLWEKRLDLLCAMPVRVRYNLVMICHMVSVALVYYNDIDTLFFWAYIDLFYRLTAIIVSTCYNHTGNAQQEQHPPLTVNSTSLYLNDNTRQEQTFNSNSKSLYLVSDLQPTRDDPSEELVV